MALPSRVRPGACDLKHLFPSTSSLQLRLSVRQPGLVANHHRHLTTSRHSPSRPTVYPRPTLSRLNPLLGRSRSRSASTDAQPSPPPTVTRIIEPNPHPDAETQAAVHTAILASEAELKSDPAYLRMEALSYCCVWLANNFPREQGFVYCTLGHLPRDIEFTDNMKERRGPGPGVGETAASAAAAAAAAVAAAATATGTIPAKDTYVWLVGRQGDQSARVDGKKQGGLVCVAMLALTPAGVGGPVMAGTPVAEGTAETPAMAAAEKALLRYVKEMQDVGVQGNAPLGELVEGCMAAVFMGADKLVYNYSRQGGFVDPPGIEFVEKRLDPDTISAQLGPFLDHEQRA